MSLIRTCACSEGADAANAHSAAKQVARKRRARTVVLLSVTVWKGFQCIFAPTVAKGMPVAAAHSYGADADLTRQDLPRGRKDRAEQANRSDDRRDQDRRPRPAHCHG